MKLSAVAGRVALGAAVMLALAVAPAATAHASAPAPTPTPTPTIPHAQPVGSGVVPLSGSFNWTASLKCCLKSRTWFQNAGWTRITSSMNCSNDPFISGYTITLFTSGGSARETVFYPCNVNASYTWRTNIDSGNYYFRIAKADDGRYISGSGTTAYP